jgi:hypothetical protein
LKWQFAFDAAVVRWSDDTHGVALVAPGELLADVELGGGGKIRRFRREGKRVFTLRVGEPGAGAVVHHDVPLVPATLIVLIKNSANHNKRLVAVLAFGIDLNGRTVGWEIGDLADFFQVHVGADEDALAKIADGLHAAGPAKNNLGAAVGTVGDGLGHRECLRAMAARRFASVTGDLLPFGFVRPLQAADGDGIGPEELAQNRFKVPFGAWKAAKKIEAERTVFGKGVTREVRLREKAKAGDPSGSGKLMPLRLADGPELHLSDDGVE